MLRHWTHFLLAAVLAFWSPIWCCCAADAAASSQTSDTCHRCAQVEQASTDSDHSAPHHPGDTRTCPHSVLRILAQVDKAPQAQLTAPAPWPAPLSEAAPLPLDPPSLATFAQLSSHCPGAPWSSLLALRCQFTI